jgi:hypothetical protein
VPLLLAAEVDRLVDPDLVDAARERDADDVRLLRAVVESMPADE